MPVSKHLADKPIFGEVPASHNWKFLGNYYQNSNIVDRIPFDLYLYDSWTGNKWIILRFDNGPDDCLYERMERIETNSCGMYKEAFAEARNRALRLSGETKTFKYKELL